MSKCWWLTAGCLAAAVCAAQEPAQRPPGFWDAVKQGVRDAAKKAVTDGLARPPTAAPPPTSSTPSPSPAGGAPTAAGSVVTAGAAGGDGRAAALPAPVRLTRGELAVARLGGDERLREWFVPALDGTPAVVAVETNPALAAFTRAMADATRPQRARVDVKPFVWLGRPLGEYLRVLDEIAVNGERAAIYTQPQLTAALNPRYVARYARCATPEEAGDPACAGRPWPSGNPLWRGDTEFERARSRDAYLADVAPALRAAFDVPTASFVVMEERLLSEYDVRAGGFYVHADPGRSALTCSPAGDDKQLCMVISVSGKIRARNEQFLLLMTAAEAEPLIKSLQERNRGAGRPERLVYARTLVRCVRGAGQAGAYGCDIADMAVYGDEQFEQRFSARRGS